MPAVFLRVGMIAGEVAFEEIEPSAFMFENIGRPRIPAVIAAPPVQRLFLFLLGNHD